MCLLSDVDSLTEEMRLAMPFTDIGDLTKLQWEVLKRGKLLINYSCQSSYLISLCLSLAVSAELKPGGWANNKKFT